MNPIERIGERIRVLRGDALLVEVALLLLGFGFLISVSVAGDPGWYAMLWAVLLVLTLVAPDLTHALLPLGVVTWWFSHAPVGSAYSLPAALSLLGVFTCLALLSASPDGVPLSRVIILRYAHRALIAAAITTIVWVLALFLREARETYLVLTLAAFAGLAVALIALPRLVRPSRTHEAQG